MGVRLDSLNVDLRSRGELAVQAGNGVLSDTDRATIQEEIDGAQEEGIKIEFLVQPIEILVKDGKATGMKCQRQELGEPEPECGVPGEALDCCWPGEDDVDCNLRTSEASIHDFVTRGINGSMPFSSYWKTLRAAVKSDCDGVQDDFAGSIARSIR
mgnify:CR=1 FL=1